MEVKKVESVEEKSIQEKEKEVLENASEEKNEDDGIARVDLRQTQESEDDKEDQEIAEDDDKEVEEGNNESDDSSVEDTEEDEEKEDDEVSEEKELSENDVLDFIKSKYKKDLSSFDELFSEKEKESEELPEDVSAFLKYKQETGRGLDDFMRLNSDFSSMSDERLLKEYYGATEGDLDDEDIQYLIEDNFSYDEELDEESDIKKKRIAKKRELAKAKKFFENQKEQYKVPVESTKSSVPEEEKKNYEAYKEYVQNSKSLEEQNAKRSKFFEQKTNELFNKKFEGFKFKIDDNDVVYKPKDIDSVKKQQSDISNFIGKYLNEDGMISNPEGYHKSMMMAMNPDKMAKYFFEQGVSHAVEKSAKDTKNIDMDVRSTPRKNNSNGVKVQAVKGNRSSWNAGRKGNGLKITKRKK